MTRAKDISKIVTDADLSGTLDVAGTVTADGADISGGADSVGELIISQGNTSTKVSKIVGTDTGGTNERGIDFNTFYYADYKRMTISAEGNISFYEDTGTTPKFIWDSSAESLTVDGVVTVDRVINATTSSDPWLKGVNGSNTETFFLKPSGQAYFGGNVGIGTSSPAQKLSIAAPSALVDITSTTGTNFNGLEFKNSSGSFYIGQDNSTGTFYGAANARVLYSTGAYPIAFFTNGSNERMRIHNNGLISIGNASADAMLNITNNYPYTGVRTNSDSTNGHFQIEFHNPNGRVGNITTTGSSTAYNTTSDYRLKENVTADWDATTRLKQLNPLRFNFIADADTTVDGFIAHEVQSVVPEAITGTHNEVDDDGNPVYQGIDQSKLVPLLVKTIQELEARIVALETA